MVPEKRFQHIKDLFLSYMAGTWKITFMYDKVAYGFPAVDGYWDPIGLLEERYVATPIRDLLGVPEGDDIAYRQASRIIDIFTETFAEWCFAQEWAKAAEGTRRRKDLDVGFYLALDAVDDLELPVEPQCILDDTEALCNQADTQEREYPSGCVFRDRSPVTDNGRADTSTALPESVSQDLSAFGGVSG